MNPSDILAQAQKRYVADLRDIAEALRAEFITPGAGKAAAYARKFDQASGYVDGGDAPGALVLAEAKRLGVSAITAAEGILRAARRTDAVLAVVEEVEGAAVKAIREAATVPDARRAFLAVDWRAVQQRAEEAANAV